MFGVEEAELVVYKEEAGVVRLGGFGWGIVRLGVGKIWGFLLGRKERVERIGFGGDGVGREGSGEWDSRDGDSVRIGKQAVTVGELFL